MSKFSPASPGNLPIVSSDVASEAEIYGFAYSDQGALLNVRWMGVPDVENVVRAVMDSGETVWLVVPREAPTADLRTVLRDLYWLAKWYRDEYPDAEPPAELAKFNGSSDVMGRALALSEPESTP